MVRFLISRSKLRFFCAIHQSDRGYFILRSLSDFANQTLGAPYFICTYIHPIQFRFVATSQMGMGFLVFLPMWLFKVRERPAGSLRELGQLSSHTP